MHGVTSGPEPTLRLALRDGQLLLAGESEIVSVRRQEYLSEIEASFQDRDGCPHEEPGLQFWDSPSTWPSNTVPTSGSVVLPANSKVHANGCLFFCDECYYCY